MDPRASTSTSASGSRTCSSRAARRARAAARTSACCSTTPPTTCSRSAAPRSRARRSSGSTTRAATSTCCATSSTPTATSCSPSLAISRCSSRSPAGLPGAARLAPRHPEIRRDGSHRCVTSTTRSAAVDATDAGVEPGPDTLWGLIFTSGTSDAPKAVICTQRRFLVTGQPHGDHHGPRRRRHRLRVHAALPLERADGRVGAVDRATARRSVWRAGSARSRWLADVRHYGATYFNYTGKPLAYILATPERPDDADNTLRVAFGNEGSPEVVDAFARRFGVEVIDAYGATEGGVAVNRDAEERAGALGQAGDNVKVVDEEGNELAAGALRRRRSTRSTRTSASARSSTPPAPGRSRATTTTTRPTSARCGSAGTGRATSATSTTTATSTSPGATPTGSASTARTSRRSRSRPTLARHPDVVLAAVYGVPDDQAGDQVMAGLVLRDGAALRPGGVRGVDRRARRRSARSGGRATSAILRDPPTTGTNKIVKRTLVHQKWRSRPGRRRRGVRPRSRRGRVPPVRRRRRAGAARLVRPLPARALLGPVNLSFSAEEQAFAAEIRDWLAAQPRCSSARSIRSTTRSRGVASGRRRSRPIAGSASTGPRSTAGGARHRSRWRSTTWSTRGPGRRSR